MKKLFASVTRHLLACSILLGAFSCNSSNNAQSDSEYHVIDFSSTIKNEASVNLSSYVSDINYIPIETNNDFLLSDIKSISASEDYIYIVCKQTQGLFQLSPQGKLIKKIGTRGRAKNEYLAIRAVVANRSSVTIEISDKIIVYSAQTGEIERIIVPSDFNNNNIQEFGSTCFLDNGSIAILSNKDIIENNLYIYDKEKNLLDSLKLFNSQTRKIETIVPAANIASANGGPAKANSVKFQLNWGYSPDIYTDGKNLKVASPFMDTIMAYKKGELVTHSILDYKNISDEQRFQPVMDTDLNIPVNSIKENEKFILFGNWSGYKFIYDKTNKETKRIAKFENSNYQGFTNDIDNGIPFWPVAVTKEKMYSFISADIFIEEAAKSNSQKMKQVAATLTEDSNPVIVVATLK